LLQTAAISAAGALPAQGALHPPARRVPNLIVAEMHRLCIIPLSGEKA
jgi:hypothetical protein